MNLVYLLRNKWSGGIVGAYSTRELAEKQQVRDTYIEELPVEVDISIEVEVEVEEQEWQ